MIRNKIKICTLYVHDALAHAHTHAIARSHSVNEFIRFVPGIHGVD